MLVLKHLLTDSLREIKARKEMKGFVDERDHKDLT